jgi:hypothetical protein
MGEEGEAHAEGAREVVQPTTRRRLRRRLVAGTVAVLVFASLAAGREWRMRLPRASARFPGGGGVFQVLSGDGLKALTFSPDGRFLAVGWVPPATAWLREFAGRQASRSDNPGFGRLGRLAAGDVLIVRVADSRVIKRLLAPVNTAFWPPSECFWVPGSDDLLCRVAEAPRASRAFRYDVLTGDRGPVAGGLSVEAVFAPDSRTMLVQGGEALQLHRRGEHKSPVFQGDVWGFSWVDAEHVVVDAQVSGKGPVTPGVYLTTWRGGGNPERLLQRSHVLREGATRSMAGLVPFVDGRANASGEMVASPGVIDVFRREVRVVLPPEDVPVRVIGGAELVLGGRFLVCLGETGVEASRDLWLSRLSDGGWFGVTFGEVGRPTGFAVSPDGEQIAVTGQGGRTGAAGVWVVTPDRGWLERSEPYSAGRASVEPLGRSGVPGSAASKRASRLHMRAAEAAR